MKSVIAVRMMKAIAIRATKSVTAIRVMMPTIAAHVIPTESFHSENFSKVSNWLVVVMTVAVRPATKPAIAIRVMKSVTATIRVMILNAVRVTIVADKSSDICSTNRDVI
jgi:hypothetical protein